MKTPVWSAFSGVTCNFASSMANCEAAMASWMKPSSFLTSFFDTNWRGSKFLTTPPKRVAYAEASKLVIGPIPIRPAHKASQFASVPIPTEEIRPTPVMTTRRVKSRPVLLLLGVRFDVAHRVLDARDLLGILVGDLDAEFLFERHDQFNGIEGIGPQVVHERRIGRHFVFVHAELFHDDFLYLICNGHSFLLTYASRH